MTARAAQSHRSWPTALSVCLLAVLLCWLLPAVAQNETIGLLVLEQADKLISDVRMPPDFQTARQVTLPDHWQHDPEGFYGSVWYRLRFSLPDQARGQWAVMLRDVNMNAELWLNGVYLGSGGSMEPPVSRYWHSPMLFMLSASDLAEENQLLIRVVAYANEFGELGRVLVGPAQAVGEEYQAEYFYRVNLHVISAVLAAIYALFMAMVWYRRRDPVFFWGALACAAWSLNSLNFFVVDPPLDELSWEKLMLLSVGWLPLLFYFFVLRIDGIVSQRRLDAGILIGGAMLNLLVILSGRELVFASSRVWQLYSMAFGLFALARVFYSWYTRRKPPQLVMLLAFLMITLCGLHDFMANNGIIDDSVFWMNYSIPAILLFIGYMMVSRFLWAVGSSEKMNQELEQRVRQAQQKIESDYQTILALETEQATLRERERIYSDMHDDMGAKLLSIIYNAENDDIRTLARSAMNDLRAIVSKAPGKKQALFELLQQLEMETRERCEQAGFAFEWRQLRPLPQVSLAAEARQSLRRLFAEAITNAIKHSSGSRISVRVGCRFGCLRVTVADNGDYTQMTHWLEGRGIQSMRHRVRQLQGKIRWHARMLAEHKSGPKGRQDSGGYVSWLLPLAPNLATGESL